MGNVTLEEFNKLIAAIWAQRTKVDEMTRAVNHESKVLEDLKYKALAFMEAAEMEKVHTPGHGTLFMQNRFSVKIPQGDDKVTFFNYLKETNQFETLATVHSQTLNAWYKEAMEEAASQGKYDFKPPGLPEPFLTKTLGFRKG